MDSKLQKARDFLEKQEIKEDMKEEEKTIDNKIKETKETKEKTDETPIVVVEQSDSDDEELDGPPGIIFVRRHRPKSRGLNNADIMFNSVFYGTRY